MPRFVNGGPKKIYMIVDQIGGHMWPFMTLKEAKYFCTEDDDIKIVRYVQESK